MVPIYMLTVKGASQPLIYQNDVVLDKFKKSKVRSFLGLNLSTETHQ